MDVFSAFPQAIITNVWEIGQIQRATEVGNRFVPLGYLDVIVDEVSSASFDQTPSADFLDSDTLLYVRPEQVSASKSALMASYVLHNSEDGMYYNIVNVGTGKNQQTGQIEHLELIIRQTEVVNG